MTTANILSDDAIELLRKHLAKLEHDIQKVNRRLSSPGRTERSSVLIGKVGASIIDAQASGVAQSATVTIQRIDPTTGELTDKTPAHTETAFNIYDESIPNGCYVILAREFESGAWLILSRVLKLWRFTLNEVFGGGTADADLLEMDGTDTTNDVDIADPLAIFSGDLINGSAGLCIQQGGVYYAIQAPCPV